ncbi:flagellar assembly protein FliH [Nitrosomonas sp.]|uniref:flagellar assembly protein FliH n=1 Tax=Nitrosomonas sp. TaxID=42353 RepID=UPI002089E250|nr:flagellar assembly protein FliH [Nitrosomonas sp.]GJL74009.1 MAG: hypothetical protein NMNS02_01150 [Nitrosomonas sp.]
METTTVIPKAKLTSCQRWKLNSLDLSGAPSTGDIQKKETSAVNQPKNTAGENFFSSPIEEEIAVSFQKAEENGHQQGYEAGYKSGFQEGQKKGYQEGKQQGESEIETELNQINTIFADLDQQIQTIDQQIAQDLLTLAVDLTKKMVSQALAIHPELILPIVQEAILQLPSTGQQLRLFLHPNDAAIIRQHMNEQLTQENWEIREDTQLEQGGCRIETSGGEIDASIETRWRRVLAAIGQKNDWIEK